MRSAIFLACLFLMSCKKLNSDKVFIKKACAPCKAVVESYLLDQEGIYYAEYDLKKEIITYHYDEASVRTMALNWLESKGHITAKDTSVNILPACCKVDSLPKSNAL